MAKDAQGVALLKKTPRYNILKTRPGGGTAYAEDLKSSGGNSLRVQFPPWANKNYDTSRGFCFDNYLSLN